MNECHGNGQSPRQRRPQLNRKFASHLLTGVIFLYYRLQSNSRDGVGTKWRPFMNDRISLALSLFVSWFWSASGGPWRYSADYKGYVRHVPFSFYREFYRSQRGRHPPNSNLCQHAAADDPPLVELMGNWLTQSSKRRFFHPFSSCMDVVAIQHLDTATVSNKNEMFCVCVQFYGVI
jgi:hypothetical protein